MSSSSRRNNDRRIYVGNLHPDTRSRDLEEVFDHYGKIVDINLVSGGGRNQRVPFAFVEFEDPRDARDAVDRRDGYHFMGRKIRVEFPKGDRDKSSGFSRGGGGGDRRPRGSTVRRTKYRVMVAGLPASASWQDLKDHMRSAGEVAFSDVFKDGSGVVEFTRYDDMRYAVKNLEDSKFKSHEGETSHISVKEDYEEDRHSRSKSKSRSRSRSRTPPRRRRADSKTRSPVQRSPSPDIRRRR